MVSQIRNFALICFIGIVLLGILTEEVLGHSYVTSPTSRSNQKQSNGGCRGPACLGPCDAPKSQARTPITIARGASISVQWPRNNHAGGFIRLAWAPTSQSDTMSVFDNNVQEIVCHERGGCKPDDPSDPNGGDSGPADGSRQPCQVSIVVPPHLTDGLWTLQWAWFGGAFSLGDYYSCVDYQISGGSSASKPAAFFLGGDYTYPNQQKCKFFNTDRLHQCVNEPCNNPVYPLSVEKSGPAFGLSAGTGSTPTPSPTPTPPPVAQTTGTSTGGRSSTSTGKLTTGASNTPVPSPPVPSPPVPSPPVPSPPAPTGSNCVGASTLSTSSVSITTVETWGNTIHLIVEFKVREAQLKNWYLQIIWPTSATSTRVNQVYNAGALACEGTSPLRYAMIKPVANWAKNLGSGAVLDIEVFATNSGFSADFIQANTQVRLFSG